MVMNLGMKNLDDLTISNVEIRRMIRGRSEQVGKDEPHHCSYEGR